MSFKLIVSIVPHNCGEIITDAAKSAGARGGSILMGTGTAANGILQLLGLGDSSKDLAYIVVNEQNKEQVYTQIINTTNEKKAHFGIMFTISVNTFARAGNFSNTNDSEISKSENIENVDNSNQTGEPKMNKKYQMINVIVNKGYAEDAMAAARKAGAGGGTIISARGTAREGDAAFFGMKIVPEKDMLIILVPEEQKESIINAIKELPCLSEAGSGIIFCNEAEDFTLLGKKEN